MAKKLYRSTTGRMIWGVCGGLGQYFDVDPTLVRVAFVVLALANGVGILLYIILAIVTPSAVALPAASPEGVPSEQPPRAPPRVGRGAMLGGAILVIVGLLFLLSNLGLLRWLGWGSLWPLILIALGVMLLLGRGRR